MHHDLVMITPWYVWLTFALLISIILGGSFWFVWSIYRPKMKEGEVVDKFYCPAHYQPMITVIPMGKTVMPFVSNIYYGESWNITIEGVFRGKTRQETYSVSESQYKEIKKGSYVDFSKDN